MAQNFAGNMGTVEDVVGYPFPSPTMTLTVAQIEALAKAGVKVELAHTVSVQDNPPVTQEEFPLLAMVRDRWLMAMRAKHHAADRYGDFNAAFQHNPLLAAVPHGDKVYVFVAGPNTAPHVIEDDIAIFPSDALLAKLHLMMEFGGGM